MLTPNILTMNQILNYALLATAIIYITKINAGVNEIDANHKYETYQMNTQKHVFDELYNNMQTITQNNAKFEKLYNNIVAKFVEEFLRFPKFEDYNLNIKIKTEENYNTTTVEDFCNKEKNELLKNAEYADIVLDHAFNCALKAFIDTSTFCLNIFVKLYKIEFRIRETLISDVQLFEDFILSMNWIVKLLNIDLNISLLHNYVAINRAKDVDGTYKLLFVSYEFNNMPWLTFINWPLLKILEAKILKHYKNKEKIINNKDIFENEYKTRYIEYIENKYPQYKNNPGFSIDIAYDAILLKRGKETKINYIPITSFYREAEKKPHEIVLSGHQLNFLEKVEKHNKFEGNIYKMEFNVLNMHNTLIIADVCDLSSCLHNDIANLVNFTDQYVKILIGSIKEKHKIVITKYFENFKNRNVQEQINTEMRTCITKLDAIAEPVKNIENMDTNTKLENLCKIDYIKYYKNNYEPILKIIKNIERKTDYFAYDIIALQLKTRILMKKQIVWLKLITKIINIRKKQEEIQEEMASVDYGGNYNSENIVKHIKHINMLENLKQQNDLLVEQNKEKNPKQCKNLEYSALTSIENYRNILTSKKEKVIYITTQTILLKSMIIEAEQDAYKLLEIMKSYI